MESKPEVEIQTELAPLKATDVINKIQAVKCVRCWVVKLSLPSIPNLTCMEVFVFMDTFLTKWTIGVANLCAIHPYHSLKPSPYYAFYR